MNADAASNGHPSDPFGEHLEVEWPIEIELLALHARIVLNRRLNLILDPGDLLNRPTVDRFLRLIGRSRNDPHVLLLRLKVSIEAAVRRKTTVRPRYVRASNLGWQPTPVPGEVVIETDGRNARTVLRIARGIVRDRFGAPSARGVPWPRRFPLTHRGDESFSTRRRESTTGTL